MGEWWRMWFTADHLKQWRAWLRSCCEGLHPLNQSCLRHSDLDRVSNDYTVHQDNRSLVTSGSGRFAISASQLKLVYLEGLNREHLLKYWVGLMFGVAHSAYIHLTG